MRVDELLARFPEIPRDLADEPLLAEFAEACGDMLRVARKPSACAVQHEPANHFYLKLVGPLAYYGYGLASRERVLEDLGKILQRHREDPDGFAASLLPEGVAEAEVKGPGCA